MAQYDFDEDESDKALSTVGMLSIAVVLLVVAIGAYFYFT